MAPWRTEGKKDFECRRAVTSAAQSHDPWDSSANIFSVIRKTKSSATLHVPDGLGGMREVFDHRFDDNWPVKASMAGKDAESWMAHCHAEA